MTRGRWLGVVAGAVVVTGLLYAIGFDLPHACFGGIAVLIGAYVIVHLDLGQRVALPRLPFGRRDGSRTEVSSLAWSLYGSDGVSAEGQRHLRAVGRAALAEAGIDIDTAVGAERAAALLGSDIATFVKDPTAVPPPDARMVRSTVLALEKLETPS